MTFGLGANLVTTTIADLPSKNAHQCTYWCVAIACVLAECRVQHSGKWEQQQHRTSFDQLFVQHKCTVMGKINGNYL